MNERLPVSECQWRLAIVWFTGAAVAFALVLGQTIGGKYGDQVGKAWSWFLPTVLPTLSLIAGVVAAQARGTAESEVTVSSLAYRLSLWLSIAYLVLVLAVPLLQPLSGVQNPLDFLAESAVWLSPVQGLVGLVLGAFFVSRSSGKQ